jgi:hypothetical protein
MSEEHQVVWRKFAEGAVLLLLLAFFLAVFVVWPEITLDHPTNAYVIGCHNGLCGP